MTIVEDFGGGVRRYTIGTDDVILLRVLDLGAAVQELWVPDAAGERANVVLGSARAEDYRRTPSDYLGAVVGRVANRIDRARFELDGTTYRLPANDGDHHLHGGPGGFHVRTWTVVEHQPDLLQLELVSADGDQGYPGELRAAVSYRVAGTAVEIDFEAVASAATPVAMTQHSHFNLAGEGTGSIDGHELTVNASRYTPVGADLIPTGSLEPVEGTPFDLRQAQLGPVLRSDHPQVLAGRGLDHNLMLDPSDDWAAVLRDPSSGRTLRLSTDQPGLQVYSGNFFDGTLVGTSGRAYRQGDGIALEPQTFPDAVNRPEWSSAVATPDSPYRASLRWDLAPS